MAISCENYEVGDIVVWTMSDGTEVRAVIESLPYEVVWGATTYGIRIGKWQVAFVSADQLRPARE